jgi:hypothetical protein
MIGLTLEEWIKTSGAELVSLKSDETFEDDDYTTAKETVVIGETDPVYVNGEYAPKNIKTNESSKNYYIEAHKEGNSIFKYFQDGTRKEFVPLYFKFGDEKNNDVCPIMTGQVISVICERKGKKIVNAESLLKRKFVVSLPNAANNSELIRNFPAFKKHIKSEIGWEADKCFYKTEAEIKKEEADTNTEKSITKVKETDSKANNSALDKIQKYMVKLEKDMIKNSIRDLELSDTGYLVKDGGLANFLQENDSEEKDKEKENETIYEKLKINPRYLVDDYDSGYPGCDIKFGPPDIEDFKFVIGISKKYDPKQYTINYKTKNSEHQIKQTMSIVGLRLFERTPVVTSEAGKLKFWYIRIREIDNTKKTFSRRYKS